MRPDAEVMGVGCPMFVPLVENGYIDSDNIVTNMIAREYVDKLSEFRPDVIILGCTHYPLIKDIVKKAALELIGDVEIVDSGKCAANALKMHITESDCANSTGGKVDFFVSDRPHDFSSTASLFLGEKVENVTQINIEDYLFQVQNK